MCIQFMKKTKAKTLLINSGQCFVRQNRLQIVSRFLQTICCRFNRPWWPSGLSNHVSNSSRNRCLGPRFKSCAGLGYWSLRTRFIDFKYLFNRHQQEHLRVLVYLKLIIKYKTKSHGTNPFRIWHTATQQPSASLY